MLIALLAVLGVDLTTIIFVVAQARSGGGARLEIATTADRRERALGTFTEAAGGPASR